MLSCYIFYGPLDAVCIACTQRNTHLLQLHALETNILKLETIAC